MKKSIRLAPGFSSAKYFDFASPGRWTKLHDGTYSLASPDLDKDRLFAFGEIKVVGEERAVKDGKRLYIAGVANANIIDRMCEVLDPVGIELESFSKNSQLLAHHSYYHPIGQVEDITPEDDGVKFKAWIGDPEKAELTPMQKEIRSLVSQGILRTVSVGFIPKKIRPPLFDDQGNMTEPMVIERWELLELSVVAVPCNQGSTFETLDAQKASQEKKLSVALKQSKGLNEDVLDELEAAGLEIQSLIFSKDTFSEQDAKDWAEAHGFSAASVDETEDSYRLRQQEPELFEEDSLKTIDLTEGVQAVIGKKKDAEGKEATDTKEDQYKTELMTLIKGMNELSKRSVELLETVLAKLEEKPVEEVEEEEKPAAEETEEEKGIDARITKLEELVGKVVKSIEVIAAKK
jgi:HK97 family phage prohead protease